MLSQRLISAFHDVPRIFHYPYNLVNNFNHDHELISRKYTIRGVEFESRELINSHVIDDSNLLQQLISDVNSDDTIYDIGANIGTYSLVLGQIISNGEGEIISFEPVPATYQRLCANLRVGIGADGWNALNIAVSDQNGKTVIYSGVLDRYSTLSKPKAEKHNLRKEIEIEEKRLDELDIEHPDIIKVDTEGHELRVLQGATKLIRSEKPDIYLEPHDTDAYRESDLMEFLENHGYTVRKHGGFWHCECY